MRAFIFAAMAMLASGSASAGPIQFVFTPSGVIATESGQTLRPTDKLSQKALIQRFPGYSLEVSDEEGETFWRITKAGRGLTILPGQSIEAFDGDAAIDGLGTSVGAPITTVFGSQQATCYQGISMWCDSPLSSSVQYEVDPASCPDGTALYDFDVDHKRTPAKACMVIIGILLVAKQDNGV